MISQKAFLIPAEACTLSNMAIYVLLHHLSIDNCLNSNGINTILALKLLYYGCIM